MTAASPTTSPTLPGGPLASIRGWLDLYVTQMRIAIASQIQYRVSNYFYMIGMIAEPVIYLVVWSTVARQQGGEVGGFTPGEFAAYYIVWTLVRNMNIALTPYAWEERVRGGELAGMLLRPIHPIHADLAGLAGWKVVVILLWLPIAIFLSLIFQPTLAIRPIDVAVFGLANWGAYVLRSMFLWLLGLVTFWTTRVGPVFDIFFTAELLLSGRLVPLSLMPDWAQQLAGVLPFQWTFGFPIEALIGQLPTERLLGGLAMQLVWIAISATLVAGAWRLAVRRFSAVGG
ncbi:MAG: ABC-2 family transporter protein [Chloroflexota bacterium]|nr:ABC-2 family transporter protein [Chloroflexota bacterium]